jgi:hypothetical protein
MGTRAFDENLIKLVQLYIVYIYMHKGTSLGQSPLVFLILQYSPLSALCHIPQN